MMSGNDEEDQNIINGEIPAPKQSYFKHIKTRYKLQQRVQKELNKSGAGVAQW